MSNILSWEFEELPLVVHNNIPAAFINGMAEIAYFPDGAWCIDSVAVEGRQELTQSERTVGKKLWVYVKPPAELDHLICERLESEDWYGKIQDAVSEQLASNRDDAREAQYDARRDNAMYWGV